MPNLLIFDFDGTIVDSAPDIIRATQRFIENYSDEIPTTEEIRLAIGHGLMDLLKETLPKSILETRDPAELYKEFVGIYESMMFDNLSIFPGFETFIESWEGKIAILSNKKERLVVSIMEHLNLQRHPWLVVAGGDTYEEMKPHRTPFEQVLSLCDSVPQESIMIGDGTPDIEGAKVAGLKSIAVEFGYSPIGTLRTLGATASLSHYNELPAVLQGIRNLS